MPKHRNEEFTEFLTQNYSESCILREIILDFMESVC